MAIQLPKVKCDKCCQSFPRGETTKIFLEGKYLVVCIPCRKKLIC
jgi:hypothetical protein